MHKIREKDLVSVIITNYNNENYLEMCLDSILNQVYPKIEIIIIDDKSTDGSLTMINKWKEENKEKLESKGCEVSIIKLPINVGYAGAVTMGFGLAKGEFIAMQDADDRSHEKRIDKQVKYLRDKLHLGAVGTNYSVFTNEDPRAILVPNDIKFGVEKIREVYGIGENGACFGSFLMRAEIVEKIGGLTRKVNGAEDYEYITKLIPYGVDNLKQAYYQYRVHEGQRSAQFYGSNIKKREKVNKNNLKVLMVLDRFNLGGTETHVLSLVKGLIKRGIKVVILADDGPFGKVFRELDCKIYNMKFPFIIPNDKLTFKIYKQKISQIIKAEDINMIHCHQSPSGAVTIETGEELNIPVIFTIHGLYYEDIAKDRLRKSNSVIAVSHPAYEWIRRYAIEAKVIPNGIIFSEFEETRENLIRNKYNIPDEAMLALYCSRLAWGKIKSCENLIRVTRDLIRVENCNIHTIIIGDGEGYDDLKMAADRANKILGKDVIHMVGAQVDVVDYFLASDCIVGTGRVAIEGMAAKKPIIATGNNGYVGIIRGTNFREAWKTYFGDHDSKKINNATYLYEDLRELYSNREAAKNIGIESYDLAKELFDIDVVIEQILDLYENSF